MLPNSPAAYPAFMATTPTTVIANSTTTTASNHCYTRVSKNCPCERLTERVTSTAIMVAVTSTVTTGGTMTTASKQPKAA